MGGAGIDGFDHLFVGVGAGVRKRLAECIQRAVYRTLVAPGAVGVEPGEIAFQLLAIGPLQHRWQRAAGTVVDVFIDPHHNLLLGLDLLLEFEGGLADHLLHEATLHRRVHAALGIDGLDHGEDLFFHFVGEGFHVVRAAEGIDHVVQSRLFTEDVLGCHGDARGGFGGNADGLVVAVRVQRLQAAENAGHGVDGDAGDIVQRLLPGQVDTRSLGVKAEAARARILGAEAFLDQAVPQAAAGAELGNFLEKADGNVEEKTEAGQEFVRLLAAGDEVVGVLDGRGQGQAHGFGRFRPCLLHVLADDGDRVPARHVGIHPLDVVQQHPLLSRQIEAVEHVQRRVVGQVVRLVGGAHKRLPGNAARFGHLDQHGGQRVGRGIADADRLTVEGNAVHADSHVFRRRDQGAAGAEQFAFHLVGIVAAQVAVAGRDEEAGEPQRVEVAHALVVILRRAEAHHHARAPGPAAVHAGVDASGSGILAGKAEVLHVPGGVPVLGAIERLEGNARAVCALIVALDLGSVLSFPAAFGDFVIVLIRHGVLAHS